MPNDNDTVQFKSPTTGVVKALGSEDWEEALSRGYAPVDHTVMFSPDGKRGLVPNAELRSYMKQGYQTTPQTQFEQDRPGTGINLQGAGTAAWETAKGIPGGVVSLLDPTRGLSGAALSAVGLNPRSGGIRERFNEVPAVQAVREARSAFSDPNAGTWDKVAAGPGAIVGESDESARQHAARGEGGSIIGEAAVPAAMTAVSELASETGAIPRAVEKIGAARESVGDFIRNPKTGKLAPGASRVAKAGGIAVGGTVGHAIPIPGAGYGGGAIGYELGPSVLERIFPESPERVSIRQAAQDELLRQKALKNPAIADPFGGVTSSAVRTTPFQGEQTLPSASKEPSPPMPKVRSRAEVQAEQEASKPITIFPEPRPESPNARPGALWSVPRTELPGAAMRGAPGAADVLRNLGEPVLFEPRGEISAPRSRTIFNAQGAPIETGAREPIPQGNPTPFGKSIREAAKPALRREVQEFVTPSRAMQTPEWISGERSYELQKGRDILRNSDATDEERAVALARIKDSDQP